MSKTRRWNRNEDKFIVASYHKLTPQKIAEHLNRTTREVNNRINNVLSKVHSFDEINYLRADLYN